MYCVPFCVRSINNNNNTFASHYRAHCIDCSYSWTKPLKQYPH